MKDKIRIHLADDHHIDGMRTLLNTVPNFEVIGFSLDGTNLYDEVTTIRQIFLFWTLACQKKDGIEVIKEFAKKGYPAK
jgi:DNA-binding NarL/FixJ family response regulator